MSQGDAGVFEENVTLADRRNVALTVRLRPGLSFLGVIGEDRLGANALEDSMSSAFADLGYWAFIDRSMLAWLIFAEPVSLWQLGGGLLILAGIYVARPRKEKLQTHP